MVGSILVIESHTAPDPSSKEHTDALIVYFSMFILDAVIIVQAM